MVKIGALLVLSLLNCDKPTQAFQKFETALTMKISPHDYEVKFVFTFQVEMNPSWQQGKLREFCKAKGIHVSAWSALGAYKVTWGSGAVMENQILQDIAAAKGKTIAQVT